MKVKNLDNTLSVMLCDVGVGRGRYGELLATLKNSVSSQVFSVESTVRQLQFRPLKNKLY